MKTAPIKNCPFCGHSAFITKESLDRGNGHGYPGYYEYYIKCGNNSCKIRPTTDKLHNIYSNKDSIVYSTEDFIIEELINNWNERAE